MVKNYFLTYILNYQCSTNNFVCILFFLVIFAFSKNSNAQVIDNVNVSANPICKPTDIDVTFRVTNGNRTNRYFTNNTDYIIYLGTLNGNTFTIESSQNYTTPSNFPNGNDGASVSIIKSFNIPVNTTNRTNYRVVISSSNPNAGFTFSALSNVFEVGSTPVTPTAGNNGSICIGGTINLTASNITGATYNWTGPNGFASTAQNPTINNATINMVGTYSVTATVNGCTSNPATTTVTGSLSTDDRTIRGLDSWVGQVYDGTNFNSYVGYYNTGLLFDENFGGNATCFPITSNGSPISIFTETFSVIYKSTLTASGVYTLDLGADDGNRLRVDGDLVYDDWSDHGYRINSNIVLSLTGSSNLDLEYYENGGGNRISINNPQLIIENIISTNTTQTVCENSTAASISGDTFNALPNGVSLVGSGYQWYYNTTGDTTALTIIPGATNTSYTPDLTTAPFNNTDTYYIYRKVLLNGSNNTSQIEHVSNPATLIISEKPTVSLTGPSTACYGESVTISTTYQGQAPFTVTVLINGAQTTFTENLNYREYTFDVFNDTTIEFINIEDANTCANSISEIISIQVLDNSWTGAVNTNWNNAGNWLCNAIPSITTDVLLPDGLTNYPVLNTGAIGTVRNLTIEPNASLEVIDNTLQIAGSINTTGIFNALNGTIEMQGSAAQTISADTFISNRIRNLIINNTSGVTLNGVLEITGYLKVANGNFNTGSNLTLISDAIQTALIDGSGNGEIIGTVKMQRYLDTAFGYKYFSSPFSNTTVGDFSSYVDLSATFPQVYNYVENSTDTNNNDITGWKPYISAASGLGTLEGYAFNFGTTGNAVTVELNGTINNGAFTRQLSNNNGIYTDGYNLIGNPYPSPIDWNAPGWTKTNIDNGIYFFSASSQYKGTYTSVVNNISSADGTSSSIIPSMQGFFVHVSDGGDNTSVTSGTLALTNAVRVNDFTQQFIKISEPGPVSLIRLSAGIKDNSTRDAMVIYFDPFAKEGFEKDMDALKLMNTDEQVPNLYSIISKNYKLSINALPESIKNTNQRIPLGLRSDINGEMSIQLKDIKNLPSNFNVYLIDDVKRIGQNLTEKPEYHFNIKAGEHNSRFFLMFSEYELSDPALAFDEPFSVKTISGKVYINLNLKDGVSGTLMATTVTGQLLDVKSVTGNETISLDGIKSSGIYFINLSWKDQQFSKKIMIQK